MPIGAEYPPPARPKTPPRTRRSSNTQTIQANGEESSQPELTTLRLSSPGSRHPRNRSPDSADRRSLRERAIQECRRLEQALVELSALEFAGERIANLLSLLARQERVESFLHQQPRENVVVLGDQQIGALVAELPGSLLGEPLDRRSFF